MYQNDYLESVALAIFGAAVCAMVWINFLTLATN